MNQFQQHIISTVRSMPDAALLDLVKDNLGAVNTAGVEAIPKAVHSRNARAAAPTRAPRNGDGGQRGRKPQRTTAQMLAMARKNPGEKRSPEDLATAVERVHVAVKNNPGQNAEQLAAALETTTKANALPIRKLLAAKKIKTTGAKRATKYYPA
jgi:hypothetical protein